MRQSVREFAGVVRQSEKERESDFVSGLTDT